MNASGKIPEDLRGWCTRRVKTQGWMRLPCRVVSCSVSAMSCVGLGSTLRSATFRVPSKINRAFPSTRRQQQAAGRDRGKTMCTPTLCTDAVHTAEASDAETNRVTDGLLTRSFRLTQYLGAFAEFRKATISFVMSVRQSAWNNSTTTGRILMTFDI